MDRLLIGDVSKVPLFWIPVAFVFGMLVSIFFTLAAARVLNVLFKIPDIFQVPEIVSNLKISGRK